MSDMCEYYECAEAAKGATIAGQLVCAAHLAEFWSDRKRGYPIADSGPNDYAPTHSGEDWHADC